MQVALNQNEQAGWGAKIAKGLFYLLGYGVIFGVAGLSMWAVGAVQLQSHDDGDIMGYWYLATFILLELWVVVGLTIAALKMRQGEWGKASVGLLMWVMALGLSAMQESRFHVLQDNTVISEAAPELAKRENALKRQTELETSLAAAAPPARSSAAIQAELTRFKTRPDSARYPTQISRLTSELADANAYAAIQSDLTVQRSIINETAELAAENLSAKQVGQTITVPILKWEISSEGTVWILIITMMMIKSLGPWLLFGGGMPAREAKPAAVPEPLPKFPMPAHPVHDMQDTVVAMTPKNETPATTGYQPPKGMRWEVQIDGNGHRRRVRVYDD